MRRNNFIILTHGLETVGGSGSVSVKAAGLPQNRVGLRESRDFSRESHRMIPGTRRKELPVHMLVPGGILQLKMGRLIQSQLESHRLGTRYGGWVLPLTTLGLGLGSSRDGSDDPRVVVVVVEGGLVVEGGRGEVVVGVANDEVGVGVRGEAAVHVVLGPEEGRNRRN